MIKCNYKKSDIKIYFNYDFVSHEDFLFEGYKPKDEKGRKITRATICIDEKEISVGVAVCRPPDNFNKIIGRKLALKDALYKIEEKDLRKVIWDNYRENCR